MLWKTLPHFSVVLLLPVLWLAVSEPTPSGPDCSRDLAIPTVQEQADFWSTLGGDLSFHQAPGGGYVRLTFRADPDFLRYDRDASLRVRTAFSCLPGERPIALRFEMRFSTVLQGAAELHDVMLLGDKTSMLPGAGAPRANQWVPVRLAIPEDSPAFHALHFGAGSAWARERQGEQIQFDVRKVVLERRQWVHASADTPTAELPQWKDPEAPAKTARGGLLVAPGAPAFAVVDFPGQVAGNLRIKAPPGISASLWVADWLAVEQKTGVVEDRAIRLLTYQQGAQLPPQVSHARRFWLQIAASGKAESGNLVLSWAGASITREVEVLPVHIPESPTRFLMYYQMNENWAGYAKYRDFYRNAPAHFEQLRSFGFTGVHIAEEPQYAWDAGRLVADFSKPGRYWQKWPLSLDELMAAAQTNGLQEPLVWEGLRIFTRDEVWSGLSGGCNCAGGAQHAVADGERLPLLANAAASGWKRHATRPLLSIGDEPGVHSREEVEETGRRLRLLRARGYRTFLTTHARMHDSFHQLAPYLDVNALHAEDVTAGSYAVPRAYGGKLWLYNGGSFNVTAPGHDRFFAGLYGWLAGAEGIAQWIYTRPSQLNDPLDLRRRLSADAQFYALPGHGDQPAATPGLMGLAAGIVDRRILDYAERRALAEPALATALREIKAGLVLPNHISEYTPAHLQQQADMNGVREKILRLLATP